MVERKMSPVLKWAGGKTQLLESIRARLPEKYNTYFEPFIGGGAVLLGICPQTAIISDINEQLINLYIQLKTAPELLIQIIEEFDRIPCNKELYCSMREKFNTKIALQELDAECAALMVWLNKHCFNGLYRVNGKGLFNVPYNNRINGKSFDADNILSIGNYLRQRDISILCTDFEKACQTVQMGDFVYFDSPYVPVSDTADFTDYTKDGFQLSDHERLAALFSELDKRGAKVMLSNNDVPMVHSLYKDYNIQTLEVKRLINRNPSNRTSKEVLITNY